MTMARILKQLCTRHPARLLSVRVMDQNIETRRGFSTVNNAEPVCWDKAVSEAEKIVGYPTSFANLRWLLSDEIANVALHLRKLVGSKHPILKTAKGLLNDNTNVQAWGLLILLVSKAAGPIPDIMATDQLEEGGVLHSQRVLAESTEMIKTGHLIHKGLINLSLEHQMNNTGNMNFGNKIALLSGDYLLVKANGMISNLRNQHISELISSALRDLTEAEFVGERDPQNFPIPSKPENTNKTSNAIDITLEINSDPKIEKLIGFSRRFNPLDASECIGYPIREWTMRNVLSGGSLLGIGCQGALHLGGQTQEQQDFGYLFGCHAALAWQASVDFKSLSLSRTDGYSLVSAPVLFALHHNESLYKKIACSKDGIDTVNYESLKMEILKGPAMEYTMDLYKEHSRAAIKLLEKFPKSDATQALENIILAINLQ